MIPYGSSVVVGDKGSGDWLPSLVVMPDGGGYRQDALAGPQLAASRPGLTLITDKGFAGPGRRS